MENLTEKEIRNQYMYKNKPTLTYKNQMATFFRCDAARFKKFLYGFFPIITWLPKYSLKNDLPGDVIGGVTTAIVRIPQSLAYGLLAGVDPINGMYTAFFSPLVYTFLGTSSHISVGTFAVVSIMLGSSLNKYEANHPFIPLLLNDTRTSGVGMLTEANKILDTTASMDNTLERSPEEAAYKLAIVSSITLLVGILQIVMGLFNLGFVALFLSDPLISGFTTGAAVYVFSAQVKYFFGIEMENRHSAPFALFKMYFELFSRINETKLAEVIISVLTIVLLYPIKLINIKYKKQLRSIPIPMELIIVILATIVSVNVDLNLLYKVEVVGSIPSGLPEPTLPSVSYWPSVISDAFSIAIVSFAITVSIGKLFGKKHGYKISANQELFALGVSQLSCAIFRGHACSGSLARSSVKESSGTKTQFSDVVSCIVMLLVLLFIGPLLQPLPIACLSSIIMVNIRTLFHQFLRLPYFWKTCKYDFAVWIITFVATILFGVDFGLMIGVVSLLASIVVRKYNASPTISGKLGNTDLYGNIEQYEQACEIEGIKIIRFPEGPFFGNRETLEAIAVEIVSTTKIQNKNAKHTNRENQTSGQSQALLNSESSESDSGVEENQESKRDSTTEYVVNVDSNSGTVRFKTKNAKSSLENMSMSTPSLASRACSNSAGLVRRDHYFNTVIFDCTGWTFIDTMGIDTVQQMSLDLQAANIKLFFAGLPQKVFNKLNNANLFDDVYKTVAYPNLQMAVSAAQIDQTPSSNEVNVLLVNDL